MITSKYIRKRLSFNKTTIISFILTSLIVLPFVLSGCNAGTSSQPKEVSSIKLQIRAVKLNTGLEILLIPRDSEGFLVETEGIIDAELWMQYGTLDEAEIFGQARGCRTCGYGPGWWL